MEHTPEDQERHLLIKVIDCNSYKLDDLVRPYMHKIPVVSEPLLTNKESDYYIVSEIIFSLSKAAAILPTQSPPCA